MILQAFRLYLKTQAHRPESHEPQEPEHYWAVRARIDGRWRIVSKHQTKAKALREERGWHRMRVNAIVTEVRTP